MKKGFQILAITLALICSLAGSALAQEFGDEGAPPQSQGPSPTRTVRQTYENGNLIVIVTAKQEEYGFRLGTQIPLEVDFVYNAGVALNLDNLVSGQFDTTKGSDFRLASYEVMPTFEQDGMKVTRVLLKVRSFATMNNNQPSTIWCFNSTFLYATGAAPNGQPNWQKAMTPDFFITRSPTADDASKDLDEGQVALRNAPYPKPTEAIRWAGIAFAGIVGASLLAALWFRLFPPLELPANVRAWKVFDEIIAKSDAAGLSYADTDRLAAALRRCLNVETLTDETQIKSSLELFFGESNKRYELSRKGTEALTLIDKALYKRGQEGATHAMSASEARELFRTIETLVPRP